MTTEPFGTSRLDPGAGEASDAACAVGLILSGLILIGGPESGTSPIPEFEHGDSHSLKQPQTLSPSLLPEIFAELTGASTEVFDITQLIALLESLYGTGSKGGHNTGTGGGTPYIPPPPPPWQVKHSPGASTCTLTGCVGVAQSSNQGTPLPYVPQTAQSTAAWVPSGFYLNGDGNFVRISDGAIYCGGGNSEGCISSADPQHPTALMSASCSSTSNSRDADVKLPGPPDPAEIWQECSNAAGGRVFTANTTMAQQDFVDIVNAAVQRGDDIHILTGTHYTEYGILNSDESLYIEDEDRFGDLPNVNLHNVPGISPEQISEVLQLPGTIIGAFCYSTNYLNP